MARRHQPSRRWCPQPRAGERWTAWIIIIILASARAWRPLGAPPLLNLRRPSRLASGAPKNDAAPAPADDAPAPLFENPLLRSAVEANGKTDAAGADDSESSSSETAAPTTTGEEDSEDVVYSPGPRELFAAGADARRAVGPPGTLAASKAADYEEWISGQLRLNRIQACSDSAKSDLIDKLRRVDLDEAVMEDLRQLVATGNGVVDKAGSTLLVAQWDEVFPARLSPRRVRFEVDGHHNNVDAAGQDDRKLVQQQQAPPAGAAGGLGLLAPPRVATFRLVRERHVWFVPRALLSFASVFDARPLDAETLVLRRKTLGGAVLTVCGLSVPLPVVPSGLLFFRKRRAPQRLAFLYVDSDVVVIRDAATRQVSVLAVPQKRSLFDAVLYGARRFQSVRRKKRRLRAELRRERAAAAAGFPPSSSQQQLLGGRRLPLGSSAAAPGDTSFGPIGDVAWQADTSMDIDDDQMQAFLDKPPFVKARFSVQDMLDGKLRLEDDDDDEPAAGGPPRPPAQAPGTALRRAPPSRGPPSEGLGGSSPAT